MRLAPPAVAVPCCEPLAGEDWKNRGDDEGTGLFAGAAGFVARGRTGVDDVELRCEVPRRRLDAGEDILSIYGNNVCIRVGKW